MQCDKIRNLGWIGAISRANLRGTNSCHLAGTDGIENSGAIGSKLEGVAVAAGDEDGAASFLFFGGSGGEFALTSVAADMGLQIRMRRIRGKLSLGLTTSRHA